MTGNFIMISEEDLEPSNDEDKYLSSDQVCDYMHVTPSTLWRMRQRGEIAVHKVGGRCLYSKNDLDALIKKG